MNGKPKDKLCTTSSPYCFAPKIAYHNFDPLQAVILGTYKAAASIIDKDINDPVNNNIPPIITFFNKSPPFVLTYIALRCYTILQ